MGTSQDILGKRTRRVIAALGVALLVIGAIPAAAALAEEPAAPPITVQDAAPEAPVPGPDAADDEQAPTPTVTIESLNPETQGVSKVFNYLVEFTCESTRLDCEEVEIDVPLIQTTPLAADAQPLSEWRASLSSSDEALVPSEPYWDSGKETRTIKLIAPLKPGVEVSVRIDLTPYRGRVANGTAWEIQPVIRASGAAEGVAPNPAKSSVTAVGALQHTTSTIGGGFRDEFRAGQTFDFNLRTSVVGVAPERDDVLYADLTRAYPLSLTLPTNIEFVAFAEGSTDGTYDPVTRTVTWNYEERQHNQKSVSLRVADAAPTGAKLSLNSAVEAHLIGESTPVSASDKRTITVLSNDLVDTTLDMDVATNFLVSGAEHVFIAPEDETSAPVTVTALLQPQHRDTTSDLGLTMPCASATTAPCGDPATYPTKPLTVSVKRGDGATGEVDVELTLTDGTTETVKVGATPFSLDRWADTLQKVEAKSLPHPVGSSTHELSVVLVVPAGAAIDTEDWLREHASATVTADDNPSEQVKIEDERANQFLRGALHVGLGSTGVIGGWSTGEQGVEIKAYVQWAAPAGERRDAASQAILLPAGLKFNGYSSGEASYSEVPDFAGTGRTLVRFHGVPSMHGGTIMVDTDSLPPGLYDYELFNGFSGFENPNCTRLYAGEGLDQDLQKRIADVFVDGQADDACHSSFPLVVTGNKTGQAIEKSVRGDLDAQWQTAPGTVGVSDDGTGTAEYRITWANTGPTELGDVVIYDLLPGTKDSGSVGQLAGMSRESDFDVTLDDVVVPAGFQVAYSESDNPCRPELGQASGTCVDDWTSDARADLSQVRALRFTADDSMPAGQSAVFNITVTLPAFGEEQAAMNTAASGATDSTGSDVLSIETPYVGVGGVLRGPDFVASKQSSVDDGAPVRPGDEIEYTLDIRNKGTLPGEFAFDDVLAEVLDDAALTKQPVATTDGAGHVAAAVVGDLLEVRGALGSGETATVTYSVTVTEEAADRGDDLLRNALVAEGETPADTCGADDTTCTVHRVEDILVEKSAVPESGSAVTGGDTVGYKIKLRNLGKQPASPEFVDHLAGVLDDATLTGGPQVDTNEVTAELVGSQLQIAGDLEPGGSAIVSYEVAVPLDAADRGDDLLRNIVTPAGETPDEECVEGSKTCTEHPIEDVSFSKTASPAAGTAVKPGEDITYTVLVENRGAATSPVSIVDHLAGVLDDAELGDDPVASLDSLTAKRVGSTVEISGKLGAGESATVTYTVTVGDEPADRGDDVLLNFVTGAGKDPGTECAESSVTCTEHPVSDLVFAKSADPEHGTAVLAGGTVDYTVTVENRGKLSSAVAVEDHLAGVLDDAALVGEPESDSDTVNAALTDTQLAITGELPAGAVAAVNYTVRVAVEPGDRGDDVLRNAVTFAGDEPGDSCAAASTTCTEHPVDDLMFSKTASPATGAAVKPGDEVTYTVSITNQGAAPSPVDLVDHLAGVLDDAALAGKPAVSVDSLTAQQEGSAVAIAGTLDAGASATVTYTVTVGAAAADRGDDVLRNYLTRAGEQPAAECGADSITCTEHPVSDLIFTKSATPDSGTAVAPGDDVTYTVNVVNQGNGNAAVALRDNLDGVLDDAVVSGDPTVTGDGLSARLSGTELAITGTIPVGASAQVSYTVTVKSDGADRGDSVLRNVVTHEGVEAVGECAEADATCTVHPIESVTVTKAASPASGTEVRAGSEVTYTVTVDNDGATTPAVDLVDHLDGVLDDAELTGAPVVEVDGVNATVEGSKLLMTGSVAPGATATVTYTVTVLADTPAGEPARSLDNFLVPAGAEAPSECQAATGFCTTHPIATAPPVDPEPPVDPKPPVVIDPPAPPVVPDPKPSGGGGIASSGSASGMPILFGGLAALALGVGLLRGRLRHRV